MTVDRREFTKSLLAMGAGLAFPSLAAAGEAPPSMVVAARSPRLRRVDHDVDQQAAAYFLDQAMLKLTGAKTPKQAWSAMFESHHRVAIKLSCLPGKPLSSSRGLVMAIVAGLRSAGLREENIWIWERTGRELEKAGFPFSDKGVRVFGTDHLPNGGYSKNFAFSGSVGTLFSEIVEEADVLVNVPVLKDHDIAGISGAMKNFYGAIYNPNKFHGNHCDPYIADLYNHPKLKNKCRLHVCDASRIQLHNGPAFYPKYVKEYGGIMVSMNAVAIDYVGWQVIERERQAMKLKSLKDEGRMPSYIYSAAKLGLGKADDKSVELVKMT